MHDHMVGQFDETLSGGLAPVVVGRLGDDFAPATRPELEYQHVFDFCAVEVHRCGGPMVVAVSSLFYARELLQRIGGCAPQLATADFKDVRTQAEASAQVVIWAEPEQITGQQALRHIQSLLAPDGWLYVITSQWPARLLPEWRGDRQRPVAHPVGLRRTACWLRQNSWSISQICGFHGPASVFWENAGRLMAQIGRADIADRCHFKMRDQYIVEGAQAVLAPVALLVATPRARAGSAGDTL